MHMMLCRKVKQPPPLDIWFIKSLSYDTAQLRSPTDLRFRT